MNYQPSKSQNPLGPLDEPSDHMNRPSERPGGVRDAPHNRKWNDGGWLIATVFRGLLVRECDCPSLSVAASQDPPSKLYIGNANIARSAKPLRTGNALPR